MLAANNPVRTEYMSHIKKYQQSGLSVADYCKQNGIDAHKFKYYKSYQPKPRRKSIKPPGFAKVNVTPKSKHCPYKIDPCWLAELIHNLHVIK